MPAMVTATETFRVGTEVCLHGLSPDGRYSTVFEDDGDSGYLYALNSTQGDESPICDALHIYDVDSLDDPGQLVDGEIAWSTDSTKAAFLVDGSVYALFDFTSRLGYCNNPSPPPPPEEGWQNPEEWPDETLAFLALDTADNLESFVPEQYASDERLRVGLAPLVKMIQVEMGDGPPDEEQYRSLIAARIDEVMAACKGNTMVREDLLGTWLAYEPDTDCWSRTSLNDDGSYSVCFGHDRDVSCVLGECDGNWFMSEGKITWQAEDEDDDINSIVMSCANYFLLEEDDGSLTFWMKA